MNLSVVVPAYRANATLGVCLRAVVVALGTDDEVIVVDDGSPESPQSIVDALGDPRVRLIRLGVNCGRGPARNAGVTAARHRWIAFVDADVAPAADALDLLRARLADGAVAVFGSYDDQPGDRGLVSQYRNLLHHVTHQLAPLTADHLFTGLAAVDSHALREVGGFDETTWARSIEDIELGLRLVRAGHTIHVDPSIQGTHLKRYTIRSMVRSDVIERAIPWTRFICQERPPANPFVQGRGRNVSVVSAAVTVVGLVVALRRPWALVVALGALATFIIANRTVLGALARRRGLRFAVAMVPLHLIHTLSSVIGVALGLVAYLAFDVGPHRGSRRRARDPRLSG
jgi:GT2 family glycosyltransferase